MRPPQFDVAKICFLKAVDCNPHDIFAHFHLGYIYKNEGKIQEAINEYKIVLDENSNWSWSYFNMGAIYFEQGDMEQAMLNLNKCLELNPRDVEAYKIFSQILVKTGRASQAIDLLKSALQEVPDNGDLYYVLAQNYKINNVISDYKYNLEQALANEDTLTMVSPESIKQELAEFDM